MIGWEVPRQVPNGSHRVDRIFREKRLGMSEQLHDAAERARLERRRRLVGEVAPYLAPGEHVLEATTGKGPVHGHGGRQREPFSLRIVVTDRRLILLRKKAFRQFAVQAFSFDTSRVSLGFTPEAGGELDVTDPTDGEHVSVTSIPELDLEPLFLALRDRMAAERLDIWIDPPARETDHPLFLPELDDPASPVGTADEESVIDLSAPQPEPARVGASTIEEILVAAGFPPESMSEPAMAPEMGSATLASTTSASGAAPSDPVGGDLPSDSVEEGPLIIPDVDPEPTLEGAGGAAQSGILRWLLASTEAGAALYLHRTADGEEHLQVEPRRLDARLAMSLVRLAADATAGPTPTSPGEEGILVTRWGEAGEERVLVLSGVPSGVSSDVTAFARFVLDRLESPTPTHAIARTRESDRPALLDVLVSIDEDDRPMADVRIGWRGGELSGRGHGHTAVLGRHLAAARAVVDALRPALGRDVVVEHLLLSYPPTDAELIVVTVLVGARRFVGATAAAPGDEETAAARAVLDALNRTLGEIA
jgi:hypothetical protein